MGNERLKILTDEKNSKSASSSAAIASYGVTAIRGAFILNGSAAVAVLTRQPELNEAGFMTVLWCAVGAGLSVLCAGASFLTQWYAHQNTLEGCDMGIYSFQQTGSTTAFKVPLRYERHERFSFYVAAALYFFSMLFYSVAVYKMLVFFNPSFSPF